MGQSGFSSHQQNHTLDIKINIYGPAKAGQPARTYIQQLCEDMGYSPEDLPEAMNDRKKWQERVRDICASGTTWWWWWWYIYIYIYICFNTLNMCFNLLKTNQLVISMDSGERSESLVVWWLSSEKVDSTILV